MRPIPLLMAAIVMIGLYFWIVHPTGAQENAEAAPAAAAQDETRPVKVVAYSSSARAADSALILRGRTEAWRNVTVRAEITGLVTSEPKRAGAQVKAGDLLCRIAEGSRGAMLDQARASLTKAQADEAAAQKLSQRGYTSETAALQSRAALESAQAGVRQAELDVERLEMRAPFDGVLESDTAELGSLLNVGGECATIIALDPIQIVGFAPETEVDRIETGMHARARLVSGREVDGIVTFVSRSADPQTRTFTVKIAAQNPDGAIRDGLTAEIAIPLQGARAHLVPQAALTLNDSGVLGVRTVERAPGGAVARFMPVKVLRDEPRGIWLTGLPETVEIIRVGQEYVSDGGRIEVTISPWEVEG